MKNKLVYLLLISLVSLVLIPSYAQACTCACSASVPPPGGPCPSVDASAGGDCVSEEYISSLTGTESCGGCHLALNCGNMEALGTYQFMDGTREDVANQTGLPCNVDKGTFAHCPELQDACFQAFNRLNYQKLEDCGALDKVGTTINGVEVTESGLLAVAHLGGAGGACNWVNSGGSYNPNDGLTALTDYAATHGGLPSMGPDCPSSPRVGSDPTPPSCSGEESPMCTASDVGTDPDLGAGFDDAEFPDSSEYFRCTDRCDNHPDGTTAQAYYNECVQAQGTSMSQFSGCCCPGEVLFGGINSGRQCNCCFFGCDDD